MDQLQLSFLARLIRKKLLHGDNITIYGWLHKNHSGSTVQYQRTGRIVFVESGKNVIKNNFLVHTKFVSHADLFALRADDVSHYRHPLTIGEIKTVLDACEDVIAEREKVGRDDCVFEDECEGELTFIDVLIKIDELLQEDDITDMDIFAKAFVSESKKHPGGVVTSYRLQEILKDLDLELGPKQLLKEGFIEGVIAEGKKKIGGYTPTNQLLELAIGVVIKVPADPFEKALYLLKNEELFISRLEVLRNEALYLEALLEAVSTVRQFKEEMIALKIDDSSQSMKCDE